MPTWIKFPNGEWSTQPQADASEVLNVRFQALLEEFHGHKPRPTCGCMHAGRPLETVIRRLGTGRFILARLPNEGAAHRAKCDFYAASPDRSGRAGYVEGVMEETADGGYTIRLGLSLSLRKGEPAPAAETFRTGRPGAGRQRAMTLLGLLHALWEEAQLNRWHPGFCGKRSPGRVAWWLSTAADQFRVVRSELGELFAAIAPDRRGGAARLGKLTRDLGRRSRLVISGTVTSIEPVKFGRRDIRLTGGPGVGLFLSALPGQADTLLAKHPYAARLLRAAPEARRGQVIGLFVVEAEPGEWKGRAIVRATMQGGALMETTADFIPVADDFERQVADRLVTEDRAFTKPLRYDADNDLVLPDFVLTDMSVASGWPMEVFGRDDADYRARRVEKAASYRDVHGVSGWWQWVAAGPDRTDMPALPAQVV